MLKKSVGSRLLAIMLSIIIIGMGLISLIGSVLATASIHEQAFAHLNEATALSANDIELWVTEQTRYIEAISTDLAAMSDTSPGTLQKLLAEHANNNPFFSSAYVGFPDGIGIFSDQWEPDYSEWRANERDWYIGAVALPDQVYITDLYKDADTGNFCITLSKAFKKNGTIAGVVAVDIFTDSLSEVVFETDVGENSYAFLTDSAGNIIVHGRGQYLPTLDENEDTVFYNIAEVNDGLYSALTSDESLNGDTIRIRSADGVLRYYTGSRIVSTGWVFYTAIPVSIVDAPLNRQIVATVIIFVVVLIVAAWLTYYSITKMIIRPVKDVTEAANLLSQGEKGTVLDGEYIGEIKLLADSFIGMENFNKQQTEWMESIAKGDLSIDVLPRGENDSIGQAIVSMLYNLNTMFSDINTSSRQVSTGSRQIAGGAQSLSEGTAEQTAAIEDLSITVGKIADNTVKNAEIANEAAKLADAIRSNAERGSSKMGQLMESVKEINDASNSIRNVIKTIDDIAFQTNILALNAAVEAARAGVHGKGFAVVADEVRDLAAKSAEAAKNTEDLIVNSIDKANMGLSMATDTAESLAEIVEGIIKSSDMAKQIATASGKQTEAIEQINIGIDQVTLVVQQTSATAEQSAAASEEMSSQAEALEMLISFFKLREPD